MSTESTKKRLIKRLQRYFQIEGINSIMFFGILVFLNIEYHSSSLIFLTYGIFLMCFILAQGTYYWWVKWSVLQEQPLFKNRILQQFQTFKKWNQYGILLIPAVLLLQWWISGQQFIANNFLGWAIAANIFAALEHINYYRRQLMYDNKYDLNYLLRNKKLKEASLYKDLREDKL